MLLFFYVYKYVIRSVDFESAVWLTKDAVTWHELFMIIIFCPYCALGRLAIYNRYKPGLPYVLLSKMVESSVFPIKLAS